MQTELWEEAFDYCNLKIVVCKGKIEEEETDVIMNSTSSNFNMLGAVSKAIGKRSCIVRMSISLQFVQYSTLYSVKTVLYVQ